MTDESHATRRTFTKGLAATALLGSVSLAGCSGGDGGDDTGAADDAGGGDDTANPGFDGWLDDTDNYDDVDERTGTDSTTVEVGTQANGGYYGFDSAAIAIETGTTVQFEWTGEGGQHNVVDDSGAFESDMHQDAGVNFEHEFTDAGTYKYVCVPHEALGMKGVIVVE